MGLGRARGGRQSRSVCTSLPSLPAWLRITTSWKAFQNKFPGHKVDAVLILPSKQTEQVLQRTRVMDIEHVSMDMEPAGQGSGSAPSGVCGENELGQTWPILEHFGSLANPVPSRPRSTPIAPELNLDDICMGRGSRVFCCCVLRRIFCTARY